MRLKALKAFLAALLSAGLSSSCGTSTSIQANSSTPKRSSSFTISRNEEHCTVRARLHIKTTVKPKDFTGFVSTTNAVVKHANGYIKDDAIYSAYFKNGELQDDSLVFIASANRLTDYPPTTKAICSINSINELKVISLGKIHIISRNTKSPFRRNLTAQ